MSQDQKYDGRVDSASPLRRSAGSGTRAGQVSQFPQNAYMGDSKHSYGDPRVSQDPYKAENIHPSQHLQPRIHEQDPH